MVLIIVVLQNICSKKFSEIFQLKIRGEALDLVRVQAEINFVKAIFHVISQKTNDLIFFGRTPRFLL